MDDGDVAVFDFEYYHVAYVDFFDRVVEEEDVAALEGWFHGAGENYYHW